MDSSRSYHLLFGLYIVAHMVLKEIMPLGGYRGFLKSKFAAKFIACAAVPNDY
jgi:hypothetical protein